MNEPALILAADDEPHILESLRYVADKIGCRCVLAEDGEAALALARDQRPRVAVLDVGMPGLDGFEVCRRLKADAATRDIQVVILTAYGQARDRAAAEAAGATEFIVKPFSPRALAATLRALVTPV